jgi:hypothetical protein
LSAASSRTLQKFNLRAAPLFDDIVMRTGHVVQPVGGGGGGIGVMVAPGARDELLVCGGHDSGE